MTNQDDSTDRIESAIAQALKEFRLACQKGEQPSKEAWLARFPDIAEALADVLDAQEILAQNRAAFPISSSHDPGQPLDAELLAEPLGDFQILSRIAQGGMGIVYEARQLSLGRRVALKVLPFAATLEPAKVARFKAEAQAAARLHHENIVPVYYVGCDRGLYYYAMQHIDGGSLATLLDRAREERLAVTNGTATPSASTAVLAQLSTDSGSSPSERFRGIAELGKQAAIALEFAHRHGILHRDIKPGNLLLDSQGKIWITDFGLARIKGVDSQTRTGDIVGTLQYLSPEQAGGRHAAVDERSDVYGLGATLFELAGMHVPFEADNGEAILSQILHKEPRPLRRFAPRIPSDLETIIGKAMAKEPAERYASAQDLADDLDRFLRHRPIAARRTTLWGHALKWRKRHRKILGVIALLLVISWGVSTSLLWRAYRDERKALVGLEGSLVAILKTANRSMSAAEGTFARERRLSPEFRAQLDQTRANCDDLAANPGLTTKMRHQLAITYLRLGSSYSFGEQRPESEPCFRQAIALFQALADAMPMEPQYQLDLFHAYSRLALSINTQERKQEAKEAAQRSYELIEKVAIDHPTNADYRDAYVNQTIEQAELFEALNDPVNALNWAAKASQLADGLVADFDEQRPRFVHKVARANYQLGRLLLDRGDSKEALALFERATKAGDLACERIPDDAMYAAARSDLWGVLARMNVLWGPGDQAEILFEKAIKCREENEKRWPHESRNIRDCADLWTHLGHRHQEGGRPAKAAECYRKAVAKYRHVCEQRPGDAPVALVFLLMTCPLPEIRNLDAAKVLLEEDKWWHGSARSRLALRSVLAYERGDHKSAAHLLQAYLDNVPDRGWQAIFGSCLARALAKQGNHDAAWKAYEQAVKSRLPPSYLDIEEDRYLQATRKMLDLPRP